ncbi:hypothetical protein ACQCZK_13930, partial [Escherichia coli]
MATRVKKPGNWRIMPDATLAASYQALYYPSSAEKIGQFSLPAVRMPYRALGSNLLRRFMQR